MVDKSETIFYNSPVGALTIKTSANELTALHFVSTEKYGKEDEENLLYSISVSPFLQKVVAQLDDYFAGRNLVFDLLLRQSGTPFQQKVWNELCKIKPGATLNYLQLSKNTGDEKAIRAVCTANGKNNIAIVVPCHRVIGSIGSLVGYAGDLWRKQWLLEHEAKNFNGVQILF
jgi:methylated-DNA-[protein]-cysteine S-methyltransferase